jgi:hypothetical protein
VALEGKNILENAAQGMEGVTKACRAALFEFVRELSRVYETVLRVGNAVVAALRTEFGHCRGEVEESDRVHAGFVSFPSPFFHIYP